MKRLLWTLGLLLATTLAFALPTVDAVQAEVKAGHYAQAESMMQEVVAAKPKSAKAHYVYAEILAHNGRFDEAAKQTRLAREADPAIGFTDPAKFRSFEQLIEREQAAARNGSAPSSSQSPVLRSPAAVAAPAAPARSGGLPGWVWGIGIALVLWALWRLFTRRSSVVMPAGAAGYGPGYGPGYGGVPMQPGGGSGLLGTGIAAAGGFAAGMLAEKMLEGGHAHAADLPAQGGLQPGMFDDYGSAASDLEQRSVDFGSGGDWGGDAGGGTDLGGGGGGDW